MTLLISRILSLLLGLTYAIFIILAATAHAKTTAQAVERSLEQCFITLLPVLLIWFPEQIGGFTGYLGRGSNINSESPPLLISLLGWLFLVALPLLAYYLSS